jgi:peptidoglycan/xylan/chitin deacetylase (PgdA/CDA1 family)
MPVPLAFHKIDNRIEWGFTRNSIGGFRRIVEYLEFIDFRCPDDQAELTFDDGYESVYSNALPILEKSSLRSIVFVIGRAVGKRSNWDVYPGAKRFRHMDADQIRMVSEAGVKIGSHTASHRNLTQLTDDKLYFELRESKRILEDITGLEVDSISYPFGRYDMRVVNTALECGYKYGYVFYRNRQDYAPDPEILNMIRERTPIYLFDTPLSIMLKFGLFGRFEKLKTRVVKSYNVFSEILANNKNTR